MRTISISIAATVLVISVVTAARAAPLDCTSKRLDAMELTKCFPGLFDPRRRQPADSVPSQKAPPSGGREGDPPETAPGWEHQDERLVYGWPFSDITYITITCRSGMADVDIRVRPPHGKAGDKTPIKFKNGASEVQHTATLTEVDGLSGDDVEFSIPTSDKLFDLLTRDGPVVARVPGASLTLPAQNGRVSTARAFRKSCASQQITEVKKASDACQSQDFSKFMEAFSDSADMQRRFTSLPLEYGQLDMESLGTGHEKYNLRMIATFEEIPSLDRRDGGTIFPSKSRRTKGRLLMRDVTGEPERPEFPEERRSPEDSVAILYLEGSGFHIYYRFARSQGCWFLHAIHDKST